MVWQWPHQPYGTLHPWWCQYYYDQHYCMYSTLQSWAVLDEIVGQFSTKFHRCAWDFVCIVWFYAQNSPHGQGCNPHPMCLAVWIHTLTQFSYIFKLIYWYTGFQERVGSEEPVVFPLIHASMHVFNFLASFSTFLASFFFNSVFNCTFCVSSACQVLFWIHLLFLNLLLLLAGCSRDRWRDARRSVVSEICLSSASSASWL